MLNGAVGRRRNCVFTRLEVWKRRAAARFMLGAACRMVTAGRPANTLLLFTRMVFCDEVVNASDDETTRGGTADAEVRGKRV